MNKNDKKAMGMEVRVARIRKGWTQKRLGEVIDRCQEIVSRLERGAGASKKTLELVAHALELGKDWPMSTAAPAAEKRSVT